MLSERIKYAMDHLSHKQHISLLARPNWRRIQKKHVHILPRPYSIRRSALKARASKRIKVMAQPKHVTKKYDPAKAPPLFPRIHPKTLAAKTTKRINDLALPTKRTLLANMRFPTSANIASTLLRVQKSRYRRYRFFCNARQQREMKRKQRILAKLRRAIKPDEWEHHMEVLEILSAPKVPPKPRPIKKKKWRPFNVRRLEELATPPAREMPVGRDPFKVPITALTYKISKRLLKIAFPKVPTEIMPPRVPGQVSPAALKAPPQGR